MPGEKKMPLGKNRKELFDECIRLGLPVRGNDTVETLNIFLESVKTGSISWKYSFFSSRRKKGSLFKSMMNRFFSKR